MSYFELQKKPSSWGHVHTGEAVMLPSNVKFNPVKVLKEALSQESVCPIDRDIMCLNINLWTLSGRRTTDGHLESDAGAGKDSIEYDNVIRNPYIRSGYQLIQ